jgi:hypothetical protein
MMPVAKRYRQNLLACQIPSENKIRLYFISEMFQEYYGNITAKRKMGLGGFSGSLVSARILSPTCAAALFPIRMAHFVCPERAIFSTLSSPPFLD